MTDDTAEALARALRSARLAPDHSLAPELTARLAADGWHRYDRLTREAAE